MRVAMILPGLGRVQRGAETAFLELAKSLSTYGDMEVELFGSGDEGVPGIPMQRVGGCVPRERFERWPRVPCLRSEYQYEELSFTLNLALSRRFRPNRFDVVLSCTYPYVNWYLQTLGRGPLNVFVTQNGDWMCQAKRREYRLFQCDGLVAINPTFQERNQNRFRTAMIPNGVDTAVYFPRAEALAQGTFQRHPELPTNVPIVFMASAMIPSKRVADGVRAVARHHNAFLVVAGDGPLRQEVAALAAELLPQRHLLLGSVTRTQMPDLFRQADVFLHMSQDEPFGIVYLEAASSGLPVVAHDGAVPHWILGETAEYADTSDLDAVAAALTRSLNPTRQQALGTAARQRIEADWTWKAQAARYREFLQELLVRRRQVA